MNMLVNSRVIIRIRRLMVPVIMVMAVGVLASWSSAKTLKVECDKGDLIQAALDKMVPGDVIEVFGACSEHITIETSRARVVGGGSATLTGTNGNQSTVLVRASTVSIENFASISGGLHAVTISYGGSASLIGNTIEGTNSHGILVNRNAYGLIGGRTAVEKNVIRNNGGHGVHVRQSGAADVLGNEIRNNEATGVTVSAGAADIAGNEIADNASDGIRVRRTGHIRLSTEAEDPVNAQPNVLQRNGGYGVRCRTNSSIRSAGEQMFDANGAGETFLEETCVLSGSF